MKETGYTITDYDDGVKNATPPLILSLTLNDKEIRDKTYEYYCYNLRTYFPKYNISPSARCSINDMLIRTIKEAKKGIEETNFIQFVTDDHISVYLIYHILDCNEIEIAMTDEIDPQSELIPAPTHTQCFLSFVGNLIGNEKMIQYAHKQ